MFRGLSYISLDAQGRLAIPTRYRGELLESCDGQSIVTIDTENPCLLIYPLSIWEEYEPKLLGLSDLDPVYRRMQRLMIGHATEVKLDSAGRVLLPAPLRKKVGLGKQVVLVGQGRKMELWDEQQWEKLRDIWLEESLPEQLPEELRRLST